MFQKANRTHVIQNIWAGFLFHKTKPYWTGGGNRLPIQPIAATHSSNFSAGEK